MIELNIQIKLLIFSLIYGFLFSILLDILYPMIKKLNKLYQIILSFILILLMAVIYFIAIDKIGYIIFHLYSIFAIIIGFVGYDIIIRVIAKRLKRWYYYHGGNMAKSGKISKATKRRLRVFGILSLICIGYFLFTLVFEIYKIYDLKHQMKELNAEYKELKKEAEELEIEIDELNDPEYLAKYARENYSYSKDGEYIIKLNETEEKLDQVNEEINKDYVVIGLVIFIIIVFIFMLRRSSKKSK